MIRDDNNLSSSGKSISANEGLTQQYKKIESLQHALQAEEMYEDPN